MDVIAQLNAALAGRYDVLREIGQGGMATVYLANDVKHRRKVALKVMRGMHGDAEGAARFLREIEIVARLQHPHIVPLYDSGECNGEPYYVMPFIEGETLRDRIDRSGALSIRDATRIAHQVASALAYAHANEVIHRDIKPSNILLSNDIAVVSDFGIARAFGMTADATLTAAGVPGTPLYMSPEHADGSRAVGPASDIYALGCVLFEMLTRRPPFNANTARDIMFQHVAGPVPSVRAIRPEVPEALDLTVQRTLAKRAEDRFASAGELDQALQGAVTGEGWVTGRGATATGLEVGASTVDWSEPGAIAQRMWRSTRVRVGIGAAVLAAGAVVWGSRVQPAGAASLNVNRVAIAPFEVLDKRDSLWQDGMVDVLARDFDGQGPLRTVAPTTIIRVWHGRADATSAAALSKATGAGIVVYGQLMRSGADSVRARFMLFDAKRDSTIFEDEVKDAVTQFDHLADSLTLRILRRLGKERPITAVARSTIGANSMVALKNFLQGEQAYRRHDTTAARLAYEQAIAIDTGFALAMRRMRSVTRFDEFDSVSLAWATRAGARNRGLSPRDSLLLLADSLAGAIGSLSRDRSTVANYEQLARRAGVLDSAARLYPNDPEVWNDLGELRVHSGFRLPGNSMELALQAFDTAIKLDPAFSSAYFHAIELAAGLRPPAVARSYALASVMVEPADADRRFIARLLQGNVSDREIHATVETMDPMVARTAGLLLRLWDDREETARRVYGEVLSRQDSLSSSARTTRNLLSRVLLRRGHLRESRRRGSALDDTPTFRDMALLGAIPQAEADTFLLRRTELTLGDAVSTLPWWSSRGNVRAIGRVKARCDSAIAKAGTRGPPPPLATTGSAAAAAHLALARHDTAQAALLFTELKNEFCPTGCALNVVIGARLLRAQGDERGAIALLDKYSPSAGNGSLYDGFWTLERARAAERTSDTPRAVQVYRAVERMWAGADPELQPYVAEARKALGRLGGGK
jgi:eukaryotic-like serine/threonine-protein kinase